MSLPYLELLRSFVVFVQSSNIVVAAAELKISQPLLTQHLKQLEEQIGIQIFEKLGRRKTLTPAGRQFYEIILFQLQDLAKSIHHFINVSEHRKYLRIGGRREILDDILDHVRFEGSVDFIETTGINVLQAFQEGRLDIAITKLEIQSTELVRRKLFADELHLVWNGSIAIPNSTHVEFILEQLQEYRFLSYGKSSPASSVFSHYKMSTSFPSHTTVEDWKKISDIVEKQKCWSIVPSRYNKYKGNKWKAIDHKIAPKNTFYIYYSRKLSQLKWFTMTIDEILSVFQNPS